MRIALFCLLLTLPGLALVPASLAQTALETTAPQTTAPQTPTPETIGDATLAQADLASLSAAYRIYDVVRLEAGQKVYRSHAIAMHGEPKYPADWTHFDYVNPEAPKGGQMTVGSQGTFDSFNAENGRGNPVGAGYESLLQSSQDEAFTKYGLIAEWVEWPEDRSWVVFKLRDEARWHDGEPITVEDIIWSYDTLVTEGQPFYRFYFGSVEAVVEVGTRQVRFTFNEQDNRELPLIIGQMPVMPKHYWEERDFTATTLDPPLTSGPYRISAFEPGRFVVRERVEDYWGADLPLNVGRHNFDRMRTEFFRDATVIRTALKAGTLDYRRENQAKAWALDYNIPVVEQGWLRKEEVRHNLPTGMQAFIMNTRRPLFQDPRVRRALAFAFDFEWTNEALFFDLYARTSSYFSNSDLAATGLPEGEELEILERHRGQIPEEVFTTPYWVPGTDGSGWPRDNIIQGLELFQEAGWEVRDLQLVNSDTGQPMRFEILLVSPAFERIVLPFVRNLTRMGIDARVRLVDQSQYINRLRSFDFDMIVGVMPQSDSPGNEQRDFWSSEAADQPRSRNLIGIKNPVIDDLISLVITAPDRESLEARTRALDRVLQWGHYSIPQWHSRSLNLLYWDKFARPETDNLSKNGTAIDRWWYVQSKADELAARERANPELMEAGTEAGSGGSDTPGWGTTLLVAAGLGFVAWLVLRGALRRRAA